MGNLAFAHTNLPKREDPMGNRVYIPPVRGVIYILRLPIRSLFSPNPHALPGPGTGRVARALSGASGSLSGQLREDGRGKGLLACCAQHTTIFG